uniref:Uncharacterized protein n=1 Tax=Heterorhabditis bacteriophora TaxID=37862 RepID=A0A1I7X9K5_HETBA
MLVNLVHLHYIYIFTDLENKVIDDWLLISAILIRINKHYY